MSFKDSRGEKVNCGRWKLLRREYVCIHLLKIKRHQMINDDAIFNL